MKGSHRASVFPRRKLYLHLDRKSLHAGKSELTLCHFTEHIWRHLIGIPPSLTFYHNYRASHSHARCILACAHRKTDDLRHVKTVQWRISVLNSRGAKTSRFLRSPTTNGATLSLYMLARTTLSSVQSSVTRPEALFESREVRRRMGCREVTTAHRFIEPPVP